MRRKRRSRGGFTLVEVALVVVIVGVLAVIGGVVYTRYRATARLSEATSMTASIRSAQEAFKVERGVYANVSNNVNAWYPSPLPKQFVTQWGGPCANCVSPNGWQQLPVTPDGPVMYGYATLATVGGGFSLPSGAGGDLPLPPVPPLVVGAAEPAYMTVAWGDTNGDGVPSIVVSYSLSGQLFVQTE